MCCSGFCGPFLYYTVKFNVVKEAGVFAHVFDVRNDLFDFETIMTRTVVLVVLFRFQVIGLSYIAIRRP